MTFFICLLATVSILSLVVVGNNKRDSHLLSVGSTIAFTTSVLLFILAVDSMVVLIFAVVAFLLMYNAKGVKA